jgi:hypothetical protein
MIVDSAEMEKRMREIIGPEFCSGKSGYMGENLNKWPIGKLEKPAWKIDPIYSRVLSFARGIFYETSRDFIWIPSAAFIEE